MKAPRWLTESFRDGVDEREHIAYVEEFAEEVEICWLARFDQGQRPCEGRFERFHFIPRQRVEHAVGVLASEVRYQWLPEYEGEYLADPEVPADELLAWVSDLPLLAAWDCRNGGIAYEAHHRRFDKHLVSVPSEQVVVPLSALPEHVCEFAGDWGLENELEARFPELAGA